MPCWLHQFCLSSDWSNEEWAFQWSEVIRTVLNPSISLLSPLSASENTKFLHQTVLFNRCYSRRIPHSAWATGFVCSTHCPFHLRCLSVSFSFSSVSTGVHWIRLTVFCFLVERFDSFDEEIALFLNSDSSVDCLVSFLVSFVVWGVSIDMPIEC